MRNVFRIFRNDLRSLYKHFFAFLIILAICILPALYAWFNVYAFGDPYKNTSNVKIAVVSDDMDYIDSDGKTVNIGRDLIAELKDDESFGYVFLDDADEAIDAVYEGTYYAAVIIEPDFTYNMYNFLSTDMFRPTISFYQNEKTNAIAVKVVEAAADNIKHSVNAKYIDAIVETLFSKLNNFSSDVKGNSTVDLLINTLSKINDNLNSYNGTIDSFISANNALIDTLKNTNSTLDYSIYLIGDERVNISNQIVYIENSQKDLSLINSEVNNMLLGIQDSIQEAIYKLDRLYEGGTDDQEAAVKALAELERQYQELIDYLKNSGITGSDIDDALSSLNTLADKITDLRKKIGVTTPAIPGENANANVKALAKHNEGAINALESDFESVTVPTVYKAVTGYEYDELNSTASPQSMESMVDYMSQDTANRIDSINQNISVAKSTKNAESRNAALEAIQTDTHVLGQELTALSAAADAMDAAAGGNSNVSGSIESSSDKIKSASDIIDDILNGNRDIDLTRDLQVISDTVSTVRVTLTEIVYPALDTMLENLQDSMGDISSLLSELSEVLGKATPIVNQLASTFGTVNNALIQVKDLIASYSDRIGNLISVLQGGENDWVDSVLEFFEIDPSEIGSFLSRPVSMETRAVYPVKNYGSAMAPFYTMLAIWIGCVIINSILKPQGPIECEGATETERFFGRYLIYFFISLLQTMIIMIGNLCFLHIQCVHPGLFLLTGVLTSLTCSMLAYAFVMAFGNIGKFIIVVIMIIQIAGSGGSYPIELLPNFFRQVYLFFPFPYAIGAMRECIAGLYKADYLVFILQLLLFFVVGVVIGLVLRPHLKGVNNYMNEQLEDTEMM